MTLCVNYNLFDGVELLEANIKQIRNHVDYVSVTCQLNSYYGNKIKIENLNTLLHLKELKLINEVLYYTPIRGVFATNPQEAKVLEKEKRNWARDYYADQNRFTHYLELDVDEFFKEEEFINAKKYIERLNLQFTACKYINYFGKPIYQEVQEKESRNVIPFICILDKNYRLGTGSFLGNSDPTRSFMLDRNEWQYLFPKEKLTMHHMSGVRKDLYEKFNNTSYVNLDRNKIPELVSTINSIKSCEQITNSGFNMLNDKFKVVDNYFNISF